MPHKENHNTMFMNIKDENILKAAAGKNRSPRKEKIQESGFSATTMRAQDRTRLLEPAATSRHALRHRPAHQWAGTGPALQISMLHILKDNKSTFKPKRLQNDCHTKTCPENMLGESKKERNPEA